MFEGSRPNQREPGEKESRIPEPEEIWTSCEIVHVTGIIMIDVTFYFDVHLLLASARSLQYLATDLNK